MKINSNPPARPGTDPGKRALPRQSQRWLDAQAQECNINPGCLIHGGQLSNPATLSLSIKSCLAHRPAWADYAIWCKCQWHYCQPSREDSIGE